MQMKKQWTQIPVLLALLVCLTGCATLSDAVNSKDEGTAAYYPVNAHQAWEIAKIVFRLIHQVQSS